MYLVIILKCEINQTITGEDREELRLHFNKSHIRKEAK